MTKSKTKRVRTPEIVRVVALAGGQDPLAKRLGVKQQAVSKWIVAGHAPVSRAVQLSEMFGVPARKLMNPALVAIARR